MDSGGSPENCPEILKKSKINDFGGSPENPRKIVLGSLKIVKTDLLKSSWLGSSCYSDLAKNYRLMALLPIPSHLII